MGRTYHKLSVGRESFEIDTRSVLVLRHDGGASIVCVHPRSLAHNSIVRSSFVKRGSTHEDLLISALFAC